MSKKNVNKKRAKNHQKVVTICGCDIEELKSLVNAYKIIQKHRIATGSQVWAYEHAEEYRKKRELPPIFLLPNEKKLIEEMWTSVERHKEGVFTKERQLAKQIENIGVQTPLWFTWLQDVKGAGGLTAGILTADLMERDFTDKRGRSGRSKLKMFCGWPTKDGKAWLPKAGIKLPFSPQRKAMVWQFVKNMVMKKGGYYRYYLEMKEEITEKHPEYIRPKKGWNNVPPEQRHPKRIHKMAMRKTIVLFLSHLWEIMYMIKYPDKKIPKPMHWPNIPLKDKEIIPPVRDV